MMQRYSKGRTNTVRPLKYILFNTCKGWFFIRILSDELLLLLFLAPEQTLDYIRQ
jgi:hypothetical protein